MNNLTKHAVTRVRQRGIPPLIVDWLWDFGARVHNGTGAEVVWFDKGGRKRLMKAVGAQVVDRLGDLLEAYIVVSADGVVVTAGWRTQRIVGR
ncbi:hypothetical protein [Cupriavidus necator]